MAGYIEECAESCALYKVEGAPGGTREKAEQLMPVRAGDKILVSGTNGWVKLQFGPRQRVTVEHEDSPYTVPMPQEGPGHWSNLVSSLSGKVVKAFAIFAARHDAREAASLTTRGSEDENGLPLAAGVLRHDSMKIASGTRRFSLSWHGGMGPFSVRIFKDGELKPVLALDDVSERYLSVEGVSFPRGSYQLELKDRLQRQMAGFTAVDRAQVPSPPAASGLESLPPDVARTLAATWRAAQDDGAWALESFLDAAEMAGTYPPARTLRDGLARGDLPAL